MHDALPSHASKHLLSMDSWKLFRIMSEFVEGFESMVDLGPSVAVFGSARLKEDNPYYQLAVEVCEKIARKGFAVITGGGPGIMEAANRGAADVEGGRSVGLGISLPFEENLNRFVTPELAFEFHYFFTRKYWFLYLAKAMVLCPGGFGTMDEFFETLTLRQTGKIKKPLPTVLLGRSYWDDIMDLKKMVDWGTISEKDLSLFHPTDSIDEAFDFLVAELEALEKAEQEEEGD